MAVSRIPAGVGACRRRDDEFMVWVCVTTWVTGVAEVDRQKLSSPEYTA